MAPAPLVDITLLVAGNGKYYPKDGETVAVHYIMRVRHLVCLSFVFKLIPETTSMLSHTLHLRFFCLWLTYTFLPSSFTLYSARTAPSSTTATKERSRSRSGYRSETSCQAGTKSWSKWASEIRRSACSLPTSCTRRKVCQVSSNRTWTYTSRWNSYRYKRPQTQTKATTNVDEIGNQLNYMFHFFYSGKKTNVCNIYVDYSFF